MLHQAKNEGLYSSLDVNKQEAPLWTAPLI